MANENQLGKILIFDLFYCFKFFQINFKYFVREKVPGHITKIPR